ncbi:MAG: protein-S-isoprenylcysteine methyltransferase [Sphingomonadaceae bacterium]|nr:protein-S-isoprenylcysteine methyltransferase [Sphingomonadaceae bacterium]
MDVGKEPRPRSAVSSGVGYAGLAGLALWAYAGLRWHMDGPVAGLVACVACAIPMVAWSLAVDKVHRRASTGIDWQRPPLPWRETLDISLAKLAGLWATWGIIAFVYAIGRWYWSGQYMFAMQFFAMLLPMIVIGSVPYMLWIDRRLEEPRDGCYAFGQYLLGQGASDRAAIAAHLRSWAVKGFFTAFMISIVPGNWREFVDAPLGALLGDPARLAQWLIATMFMVDVAFATVGYLLTFRPLDSHIRSANPYAAGWAAALMCYPPFIMMNAGGPLDYHQNTQEWTGWFAGHPTILAAIGAVLVILTGIYAWATVSFGLRFSNLTHRGILTHGPYAWSKHPAYLSKNIFWWIGTMPFLATTGALTDAVRNTVTLGMVSGVYYWRARTEERHLASDPDYVAYAAWMARHGPVPRFFAWLRGGASKPAATLQAAE